MMSRRPKKPAARGQGAEPAPAPKPAGLTHRSSRQKWVTVPRVPQLTVPDVDETERQHRDAAERRHKEETQRTKEATAATVLQQQLGQLRAEVLSQKNALEKLEADRERLRSENATLSRRAEKLRRDLERVQTADPEESDRLRAHVAELQRDNEQLTSRVTGLELARVAEMARLREIVTAAFVNVELLEGSLEALVELPSREAVLRHLRDLDSGRAPRAKRLESVAGYAELHFGGTKRDNGRLYYGRGKSGKYRVLISLKFSDQTQARDLEKLKRWPPV